MSDKAPTDNTFASVSKMTSAVVAIIAFVAVIAHSVWLVAFLAVDFLMRGSGMGAYSLLERVGEELAHYLGLEPGTVDAAHERFAARIGFIVAFAAAVLYGVEAVPAGSVVTALIVLATALEAGTTVRAGSWFLALLPPRLAALLAR